MEPNVWAGIIGSILIITVIFGHRFFINRYYKNKRQKLAKKTVKDVVNNLDTKEKAEKLLEETLITIKARLPYKVEEGVEWKEQNLTSEYFEYVYYFDVKNPKPIDLDKIKARMTTNREDLKNIAIICEKTGRHLAFRYVYPQQNKEYKIILNSSDFKS